jgi:cytidine deaminase
MNVADRTMPEIMRQLHQIPVDYEKFAIEPRLSFPILPIGFVRCVVKNMDFEELYRHAKAVIAPSQLSKIVAAGSVGAAILAANGKVYTGVCIDTACSMGFCAEHAAAAAMITAGESRILKIVAVGQDGRIRAPCGRCREFISQIHDDNFQTEVAIASGKSVTIRELLPYDWRR